MRKTMSLKQIAANRRNAQKSTGPQTPAGRAVSKMNAFKHGILSKEVVVHGRCIMESDREFAALHQRLWEDLNPVGPLEEMLVDQIVTTHWRLRRALKAESGEIALSVDEGHWKRSRCNPYLQWTEWEVFGDPIPKMHECSIGNGILERWLGELRKTVEQEGELTEAAIQNVIKHFGGKPNSLTKDLEELRSQLQHNPERLEPSALRAKQKEQALACIDRKLRFISWEKSDCEEREKKEEEARQAAAVLPSPEVLDKIMRYVTKLERQLYRAMNQLERLQRMRQGEAVPPPLTMEVSERPE
jgi:hypothetical protein